MQVGMRNKAKSNNSKEFRPGILLTFRILQFLEIQDYKNAQAGRKLQ